MIKLLDCTLRDGGYINDWRFGKKNIKSIKKQLEKSRVDVIELGFLRDEPKNEDRTVFSSIDDVKSLIGDKLPDRQYAVMTEVSNPYPLDKLQDYSADAPDIIRVVVWKSMLKEGLEYCKGIVEKGYKIYVQPARVSQYSDKEFVNMVKAFEEINPLAVYIVDSWGTMYKDDALHYLKLADESLKNGVAVGYHGHNNMMQAFSIAQSFCECNIKRDIVIDASVYGIGRGAGNLNTEVFTKWANEKNGKNYNVDAIFDVFDDCIWKIYEQRKWGFSIPYLITAEYNANPDFADFFTKVGISETEIKKCIDLIPSTDRIIFDENVAYESLIRMNKEKWNKKIAIIVITERSKALEGYFMSSAQDLYTLGIDLIIFSSDEDGNIKRVTDIWREKYDNIKYHKHQCCSSTEEKVIAAYKTYLNDYEYVLVTRDGTPMNVDALFPKIEKKIEEKNDLIVINGVERDWQNIGSKEYTDIALFFKEQFRHMLILGVVIVKSDLMRDIIENIPLDRIRNCDFWHPVVFFEYLADKNFTASVILVNRVWRCNSGAANYSWWWKDPFRIWAQRYYEIIMSLPPVYDKYKGEVLNDHVIDCDCFSLDYMIKFKRVGGLTLFSINKYKKYFRYVSDTPLWLFYVVLLSPKFILKMLCKYMKKYRLVATWAREK